MPTVRHIPYQEILNSISSNSLQCYAELKKMYYPAQCFRKCYVHLICLIGSGGSKPDLVQRKFVKHRERNKFD